MIDTAIAAKLITTLGHSRVYPDGRWLSTNLQTGAVELMAELPVVMYRQTGGSGSKSLDLGVGGLRDDFYLIEVFADGRDECSEVRDILLDAFKGPLDADNPGGWAPWSGVSVHWAEIDDPEAGAEFPETDAHMRFNFVRMVLTVQWHKEQ